MRIEHIAMYVDDLEAARDFFVTYLDGKSNSGYHNKTTDFRFYTEFWQSGRGYGAEHRIHGNKYGVSDAGVVDAPFNSSVRISSKHDTGQKCGCVLLDPVLFPRAFAGETVGGSRKGRQETIAFTVTVMQTRMVRPVQTDIGK